MSTARAKRSWSLRPRASLQLHPAEVSQSAPVSEPASQPQLPKQTEPPTLSDAELLQSTRKKLSDIEDLLNFDGASLEDSRVLSIRHEIEEAMPRLYALTDDLTTTNTKVMVRQLAEDFLRKFPDAESNAVLRPPQSTEAQPVYTSPQTDRTTSPAHLSPPTMLLPQVPGQHGSMPQASLPPAAAPQPAQTHAIPSRPLPGPTAFSQPSPHNSASSSSSGLNVSGLLRAPSTSVVDGDMRLTQPHMQEAVKQVTRHQKMLLFAVHDLLSKSSFARYPKQPWYEPPVGLSPEEVSMSVQGRHGGDVRFTHHNIGVRYPAHYVAQYPSVSRTGITHPSLLSGNRSVAVGRSHQRTSSNDSMYK